MLRNVAGSNGFFARKVPVRVLVVLSLGSLLAAGCGSSSSGANGAGGKTRTVYVSNYASDIAFYHQQEAGLRAQGKKFGWNVKVDYGDNTAATQVSQIQTEVALHPDLVAIDPVNADGVVPAVQSAVKANIPVVSVGNTISATNLLLTSIGTNYTTVGRANAQFIARQLHGKGVVALIHGIQGVPFTEQQIAGAMPVFKKYPRIQIIDGGYSGGYSTDTGLDKTENLLAAHSNIDAMMFDSDDQAVGGIKALQARGISPKSVIIVGTNGSPTGLNEVRSGLMTRDVSLCAFTMGEEMADIFKLYFDTGKVASHYSAKYLAVTPANIGSMPAGIASGDCGAPEPVTGG